MCAEHLILAGDVGRLVDYDHNGSHQLDIAWLLGEIESLQNKKRSILVVTHHAPSLQDTSSPQHANNPWSSAFATDVLSQIPKSSGINSWILGHTLYHGVSTSGDTSHGKSTGICASLEGFKGAKECV